MNADRVRTVDDADDSVLVRQPPKGWDTLLLQRSPKAHAEVMEVIEDYVSGGTSSEVFSSMPKLRQFLIRELSIRGLSRGLESITDNGFRTFCAKIRDRCSRTGNDQNVSQ